MAVDYGSLPFAEALEFLRQKLNLPTKQWEDLLGAAHDRAFVVAGVIGSAMNNDQHIKCHELIALMRRAMMATVPALRAGADLKEIESLLWEVGQGSPLSESQKAAIERLEQLAGYVAGPEDGECYP